MLHLNTLIFLPSIGCDEMIAFSQLEEHLITLHGFDCKHLIQCNSVKRWIRDIDAIDVMQFGMEKVANVRQTEHGAKSIIFKFIKKLGALATIVAPQIQKMSFAPSQSAKHGNFNGVVLQVDFIIY